MTEFGRLKDVDVREAWPREDYDFTPWLAENLDRLSEAIGIQLEPVATEFRVGRFRADIVAGDLATDSRVLIENQLDWSDHKHLGQVMTYLAGVQAKTVVWVARDFDSSHLSAVRWLNEHTKEPFAFFAVRVRVVRVADSPMVPVFDVLESPSAWNPQTGKWDREIRDTVQPKVSELTQFRQDFWAHYADRYPDDGVAAGHRGSSFWVRIESADLILAPYVAYGVVGVWVRGERGESPGLVQDRIRRWSGRLGERLGAKLGDGTSWGSNAGSHNWLDTKDLENWPDAADWLHNKIADYRSVFEGPPDDEPEEAPSADEAPEA